MYEKSELTKIEVFSEQQFFEFVGRLYEGIDIISAIDSGHCVTLDQLRENIQMSVDNLDGQLKRQRQIKGLIDDGILNASEVYGCRHCFNILLPGHTCN